MSEREDARIHTQDLTERAVADVRHLPTVTFGSGGMAWWGTIGFAVIEGLALLICVTTYFYLRRNFPTWPPEPTPPPSLGVPTLGLAFMLISVIPMWYSSRCAKRFQTRPMMIALSLAFVLKLVILFIRWYEFKALNIFWNSNSYGSIQWITLGFHATLLIIDAAEDLGLLLIFALSKNVWERHFADITDDALYWYITVAVWIPLFLVIYCVPYI